MTVALVISIIAIASTYSVGEGAYNKIKNIMDSFGFGANSLLVVSGAKQRRAFGTRKLSLTAKDENMIKMVRNVTSVNATIANGTHYIKYKGNMTNTFIDGSQSNWAKVRNWRISIGRFFSPLDYNMKKNVIVIGYYVYKSLFGSRDPLGRFVNIGGSYFKIIGVLQKKGSIGAFNLDNLAVIPATTFMSLIYHTQYFRYFKVNVNSPQNVDSAADTIAYLLKKAHHISKGSADDFHIIKPIQIIEIASKAQRSASLLLFVIAAISMIVGGVVVMNMMLSYIEKKRYEIAIKKSFGATNFDIMKEISLSGAFVGFFSSILGLCLTYILINILSKLTHFDLYMNFTVILISILFSTSVSFLFSLIPAYKTIQIKPAGILT